MELSVSDGQFHLTLYAKTHITGYIGCTTQSMLSFFLNQTNELRVNQGLTLHRNRDDHPYTYYFIKDGVRVEVQQDEVLNFLVGLRDHVKL